MEPQLATLRIWADDQPGVLCRVVNIVAAHNANIVRLSAGTEPARAGIAAITLVARLSERQCAHIMRRIRALVQVRLVIDVSGPEGLRAPGASVRPGVAVC